KPHTTKTRRIANDFFVSLNRIPAIRMSSEFHRRAIDASVVFAGAALTATSVAPILTSGLAINSGADLTHLKALRRALIALIGLVLLAVALNYAQTWRHRAR